MPSNNFTAPSPVEMEALLPAFEFTDVITSGPLGAVYFANQKSLGRQVAIKVFSPMPGDAGAFRKSFENASKAMAGLRHPNLIGLLDSGFAGDMPYQVMEFVPGKSLSRSTRGQVIEFGQAMALFDGICEGLSLAHGKGLVHGNLDTLSILLNQQAAPKIGNFGLDMAVHTDAAAVVPTHCTAPEVLAKSGPATVRSDVYSLGAIFYELITGTPLGPEAAPASKVTGCRPEIDAVLKKATATDPAKRMADVRAFQTALKEAAADPETKRRDVVAAENRYADGDGRARRKVKQVGFDYKILVKIAIIIGLLFGINFAWKAKNKAHADRAQQNRDVIAKGEQARKDAIALAAEQRAANIAKPAERKVPETVEPKFVPEVESPERSLARLKSSLAAGRRVEMPVGTVRKGDSDYFLVSEAMPWAEAAWFAEQHGGHLAMPDTDLTWLPDEVTKGKSGWLGAARSGAEAWVLADGTLWTPPSPPAGSGPFLAIGQDGGFTAADDSTPLPFVIQWRSDGSNPGTLAATLAATRLSLGGDSPVYPPGTIASGSRHYLFVPRPVTWEQAGGLAESGGGHLMVPSDSGEIKELDEMTNHIIADDGIWLGASLDGDVWQWSTGEPWTEANWIGDAEAGEEGSAMVLRPGKGWDAMPRDDEASGFLIEWSEDRNAAKPGETVPAASAAATELTARVRELAFAADKKRSDALVDNVKKFSWDLDAFVKNLPKSGQQAWGPHVDALKECVDNDRILPGEIEDRGISVSTEMAKLINYHVKKQGEIGTQFAADMVKIRDAFVVKLAGIRDEAKAAGQNKISNDTAEAIEDAEDLDAWIRSFGLIPAGTDGGEE